MFNWWNFFGRKYFSEFLHQLRSSANGIQANYLSNILNIHAHIYIIIISAIFFFSKFLNRFDSIENKTRNSVGQTVKSFYIPPSIRSNSFIFYVHFYCFCFVVFTLWLSVCVCLYMCIWHNSFGDVWISSSENSNKNGFSSMHYRWKMLIILNDGLNSIRTYYVYMQYVTCDMLN